jgi:tetratricopeptide (TPR) repeat protein
LRERILICIAALVAFGGCLGGGFVFDDFGLLNDATITSTSGWWACWKLAQTRPLTWFSFWANYQAGGENPLGYHLVNLLLHLAVALLVFDVLRRLIPARAAFIAAAIFAVHPMVTEPVAYVFARGNLLAALFSLLAIRSWIGNRVWAAVVWFGVAMLAKEECAALPIVLLLLDWSRGERKRIQPLAAMFAIALAMGSRVLWALHVTPGVQAGTNAGISPAGYLAAQGVMVMRYLRILAIPWGFSVDYSSTPPGMIAEIAAWIGGVALIAAVIAWRGFRNLRAGFWFVAGIVLLIPSSSIFPAADLANDRRMYIPLIAFAACAGLLLEKLDGRAVAAIVIVLAGISIRYTSLWRDPEKLWTEAVLRAPDKLRPRLQLARSVPPDRALAILDDARAIAPDDPSVSSERGRILLTLGRPEEALAAFGRALALDPSSATLLNNRGAALAALGQADAARADFERALSKDTCLFDARLNLLRMGVSVAGGETCSFAAKQKAALGL